MGISVSGLGTGYDWSGILDQLRQVENQKLTPIQTDKANFQDKANAWQTLGTKLTALKTAIDALKDPEDFDVYNPTVSSSSTSVNPASLLSVTADTTAGSGLYDVKVLNLAQAEKLQSNAVADPANLGWSGSMSINGQAFTLGNYQSLQALRDDINSKQLGVTASILQVSSTDNRLIITSDKTGYGAINFTDDPTGDYFHTLQRTPNLETAAGANDQTNNAGLTGGITVGSNTVSFDGKSLETIAKEINDLNLADNATGIVASVHQGSDAKYHLTLTNAQAGVNFTDTNSLFQASETGGEDSFFVVDGFVMSRSSNSVTDAVPGLTLNMEGESPTSTVSLDVSRDNDAIGKKVKAFVDAYNAVMDYVKGQTSYDATAKKTGGPLFSDGTLRSIKSSLQNLLISQQADGSRLSDFGISFGSDSKLTLDSEKFQDKLQTQFSSTASFFNSFGASLDTYLNNQTDSISGTVTVQQNSAQSSIDRLDKQLQDKQDMIDRKMQMMTDQFNNLESALTQMKSQSSWLSSQLASLSNSG